MNEKCFFLFSAMLYGLCSYSVIGVIIWVNWLTYSVWVTPQTTNLSFLTFIPAEIEAKEACTWLRAAGFPQYAQLYEGEETTHSRSHIYLFWNQWGRFSHIRRKNNLWRKMIGSPSNLAKKLPRTPYNKSHFSYPLSLCNYRIVTAELSCYCQQVIACCHLAVKGFLFGQKAHCVPAQVMRLFLYMQLQH